MVVLCGSGGGMRKCMWAPGQNLVRVRRKAEWRMEVMLPGAGCPCYRAGCPGSGSGRTPRGRCKSGQNSEKFVDGNWGKVDGKLDLPATHEIRGSNPTKLHHTNKSQTILGLFLSGNFRVMTKNNKIKLENKERGLRNRDQRGS